MDDDVAARLLRPLRQAEADLGAAAARAAGVGPRWTGAASTAFHDALAEDLALLARARTALDAAVAAAVVHSRAADRTRAALLAASGAAASGAPASAWTR